MTVTPCVGRADVYDTALHDEDATDAQRAQAIHTAAALCNGCPLAVGCTGRVTVDAAPAELVLLPDDWMPPETAGVPIPEAPPVPNAWPASRRQGAAITVGREYVRTEKRPAVWARMAGDLAAAGRTVPQIADALCVSEDTVRTLLGAPAARTAA